MREPVVIVPLHRPDLPVLEQFGLGHSLAQLKPGRRIVFIGPQGLDLQAWRAVFGGFEWLPFAPEFFASVQGYSRLLLSTHFYQSFAEHEHMLVLQPDALLLRDDLAHWTAQPWDYIGAPWPVPVEMFVNLDQFSGDAGWPVRALVGNGGFSLRRVRGCLRLLCEFPQAVQTFQRSGSSEDLFFSVMGSLSAHFRLPGELTAARFARELQPQRYQRALDSAPMGGHAWWSHDPVYWLDLLGPAAEPLRQPLLAAHAASAARSAAVSEQQLRPQVVVQSAPQRQDRGVAVNVDTGGGWALC